jgi:hypothetical protein
MTAIQKAKTAQIIDYDVAEATIAEWAEKFLPLQISDIHDNEALAVVHDARMMVKNTRVEVEHKRKELKADALEYGRTVDAEAKRITSLIEPIEAHLIAEEERVLVERERLRDEKIEKERQAIQDRIDKFAAVGLMALWNSVADLTEAEFDESLARATEGWRIEMARQEAQRQEIAAAEAERKKAAEKEAAKLKAEAAALAAERRKFSAEKAEQQAEADRLAQERRVLENEREEAKRAESLKAKKVQEEESVDSSKSDYDKLKAVAVAIGSTSLPKLQGNLPVMLSVRRAIDLCSLEIERLAESLIVRDKKRPRV